MVTMNMIKMRLGVDCIGCHINQDNNKTIENIVLLNPNGEADNEKALYIGAEETIKKFLRNWDKDSKRMLIISGKSDCNVDYLKNSNISYIVCPLDMVQIGNYLLTHIFNFNRWCDEIRSYIYHKKSIRKILCLMAEQIKASFFWMNSGFRLLASESDSSIENPYSQELLTKGFLSHISVNELFGRSRKFQVPDQEDVTVYEIVLDSGQYLLLCKIQKRHSFLRLLLIVSDSDEQKHLFMDYTLVFSSLLQQYASLEKIADRESEESVSDLLSDLIEQKIESEAELSDRISRTPKIISKWYQCIVVGFEGINDEKEKSGLIYVLRKLFPDIIVLLYDKFIFVLVKKNDNSPLVYNRERLEVELKQYYAYACIGNHTEFLTSLRPVFFQTKTNLCLGMKLNRNKKSRILIGEHYQLFQIIHMCANTGIDVHGGELIYLCSPRYSALKRYDRENQENLCVIFDVYIKNNCNASQTAIELFLHRNTLINKLSKIEEIVKGSLDNYALRFDLMFSAAVMEYAAVYLRKDIFELYKHKILPIESSPEK